MECHFWVWFTLLSLPQKDITSLVLHPGRLTWNLEITHLERKMIFQTSMIMFAKNDGKLFNLTCIRIHFSLNGFKLNHQLEEYSK